MHVLQQMFYSYLIHLSFPLQDMASSGCIRALLDMVMCSDCSEPVLVEVTAALAVLADDGMSFNRESFGSGIGRG